MPRIQISQHIAIHKHDTDNLKFTQIRILRSRLRKEHKKSTPQTLVPTQRSKSFVFSRETPPKLNHSATQTTIKESTLNNNGKRKEKKRKPKTQQERALRGHRISHTNPIAGIPQRLIIHHPQQEKLKEREFYHKKRRKFEAFGLQIDEQRLKRAMETAFPSSMSEAAHFFVSETRIFALIYISTHKKNKTSVET